MLRLTVRSVSMRTSAGPTRSTAAVTKLPVSAGSSGPRSAKSCGFGGVAGELWNSTLCRAVLGCSRKDGEDLMSVAEAGAGLIVQAFRAIVIAKIRVNRRTAIRGAGRENLNSLIVSLFVKLS